jgi:hypothetical protein
MQSVFSSKSVHLGALQEFLGKTCMEKRRIIDQGIHLLNTAELEPSIDISKSFLAMCRKTRAAGSYGD